MSNTPSLSPKELIKILKQKGFILDLAVEVIRFG